MPILVVAVVGFTFGWVIGVCLVMQAGVLEKHYRGLLGFFAFLAGLIVFGITVGEANHQALAFQFDETLVERRWSAFLLWALAGFALYPFRRSINAFITDLIALTLKPPSTTEKAAKKDGAPREDPPRDEPVDAAAGGGEAAAAGSAPPPGAMPVAAAGNTRPDRARRQAGIGTPAANDASDSKYLPLSFPWFIEVGIFGAILIAVIFAFNPRILNGLTSFKAGGIEAHFATTGPALEKEQISVVDANRKSVLTNWCDFNVMDPARLEIYNKNPDRKKWRIAFADNYFRDQLDGIFAILSDREFSYRKLSAQNFATLEDISTRLSNAIESNLDERKNGNAENTPGYQVFLLKKVSQEILLFRCRTHATVHPPNCENKEAIDAADCWAKAAQDTVADCQRYDVRFPYSVTMIEQRASNAPDGKAENIWDPYIIQGVADLLGLSLGSRERANFLEVVTTLLEKDSGACDGACTFPFPGQMSLVYAAVEAKIESDQPWPFDHMYQQVSDLLADTRRIVDADGLHASTREVGHRNRLIDLSLGLQLFYQRALTGQRFTQAQMQSWSEWLRETRVALNLLEDVGLQDDRSVDDSETDAWRKARETIESEPAVVQDAATAAALSSVLLPAQGDGVSAADCVEARSLMDFASSRNLDRLYRNLKFDPDEKAAYKGLTEQMTMRIEAECER